MSFDLAIIIKVIYLMISILHSFINDKNVKWISSSLVVMSLYPLYFLNYSVVVDIEKILVIIILGLFTTRSFDFIKVILLSLFVIGFEDSIIPICEIYLIYDNWGSIRKSSIYKRCFYGMVSFLLIATPYVKLAVYDGDFLSTIVLLFIIRSLFILSEASEPKNLGVLCLSLFVIGLIKVQYGLPSTLYLEIVLCSMLIGLFFIYKDAKKLEVVNNYLAVMAIYNISDLKVVKSYIVIFLLLFVFRRLLFEVYEQYFKKNLEKIYKLISIATLVYFLNISVNYGLDSKALALTSILIIVGMSHVKDVKWS
jgi:hypothetical protein